MLYNIFFSRFDPVFYTKHVVQHVLVIPASLFRCYQTANAVMWLCQNIVDSTPL